MFQVSMPVAFLCFTFLGFSFLWLRRLTSLRASPFNAYGVSEFHVSRFYGLTPVYVEDAKFCVCTYYLSFVCAKNSINSYKMYSIRLLYNHKIAWACIWKNLSTSERSHIYRKTCHFGALAHIYVWLVSLSNHKKCDNA